MRLGRRPIATARLAARAPDGRHVSAVSANDLAAFASRDPRLVGAELVGTALRMRRLAALAGDFALLAHIHRCEPTVALRTLGIIRRHIPLSLKSLESMQLVGNRRCWRMRRTCAALGCHGRRGHLDYAIRSSLFPLCVSAETKQQRCDLTLGIARGASLQRPCPRGKAR
jgi:hypothetical protein